MIRFPGFVREAIAFLGNVNTDKVNEVTPGSGVTVDGVLLKDNGITLGVGGTIAGAQAASNCFMSGELTGTGAPVNTPHGFGVAPKLYQPTFVGIDGNANAITAITADATNLTCTVTTGQKYRWIALK